MYLTPFIRSRIYPAVASSIRNARNARPSIKIGKERFELALDVRNFNKDEIKVKAHPKYVTIEGKKETKTTQGWILSQFIKRYRLPEGCKIKNMESRLSPEGILTVSAPRSCGDPDVCNTVVIPIQTGEPKKKNEVIKAPDPPKEKTYANPCDAYLKVKPRKPND